MRSELDARADELIKALGALGAAQEAHSSSFDISKLTFRAQELADSLALLTADS